MNSTRYGGGGWNFSWTNRVVSLLSESRMEVKGGGESAERSIKTEADRSTARYNKKKKRKRGRVRTVKTHTRKRPTRKPAQEEEDRRRKKNRKGNPVDGWLRSITGGRNKKKKKKSIVSSARAGASGTFFLFLLPVAPVTPFVCLSVIIFPL